MDKGKQAQTQYRLFAQNRDNQLIIEIIGQNIFISRTAHEIIANPQFLRGFTQIEVAIISYIASSSENISE